MKFKVLCPLLLLHINPDGHRSVPVVIVFTQYDRLERSKRVELRADNRDMDEFSLRNQSVREASNVFDDCLKSLRRAMFRLAVPMPHCVKVSGMFAGIVLLVLTAC